MATEHGIPPIDVESLFGGPSAARTTQFVEFKGMESMRRPLRGAAA
ncbi:MAG TPA: hypothetical protein VKG05_15125 [Steroidobacteraceae bacterium]|nr:hypothetical protein [Steroidobacteraceae bacterium]